MNSCATSLHRRKPVQLASSPVEPGSEGEKDVPAGALCCAAMQALEIAGSGFILAGPGGQVQFVSRTAERQLRDLPLKIVDGKLTGANELDTRRVQAALRWASDVRGGESRPLRLSLSGTRPTCQIYVSPVLDEPGKLNPPLALVLLGQDCWAGPGTSENAPDLTQAELRLLRALVRGERLAAYARNAGVKMTTVKTHLQRLFDKTGQRRQSDLIRHALSDPLLRRRLAEPEASPGT